MRKRTELTEFQKTAALVAVQIYNANILAATDAQGNCENVGEIETDSCIDAISIVNTIVEMTE